MGWGIIEDAVEAGVDKVGDAVGFVGLLFVPDVNVISGAAITAATNIARGAAMAAGLAVSESVLAIIGSIAGSAVVGAVLSVTLDLAVAQPVKIALGAQDGITLDHLASTAAYGAGGGAIAAGFSSGAAQRTSNRGWVVARE
ncbi:hypothetical protein [Embleya sp. NPDC020630]|uniref:hypothetical protein n=1 Tax=Embleya sp. NPDC020630 TaxID=3363979 RepID=UPI0037B64BF3